MTLEEIKELIQVVNETGIAELEVARGDNRVRIRRTGAAPSSQEVLLPATQVVASVTPSAPAISPPIAPMSSAPANPPVAPAGGTPAADSSTVYIKSPIVGTYYESPSPGSPVFVKVGDRVTNGQVLCIIESMKLMNEIESELTGTIIGKLVENGKPVEYGEALFAIQPA
jgi:acetyl-CoA carboxylase biotin carboxyl carrier protein